jgi:hypothetical protein
MTTEPHPFPVVCGARETRPEGTFECVMPTPHPDKGHVYVRLCVRPSEAAV